MFCSMSYQEKNGHCSVKRMLRGGSRCSARGLGCLAGDGGEVLLSRATQIIWLWVHSQHSIGVHTDQNLRRGTDG